MPDQPTRPDQPYKLTAPVQVIRSARRRKTLSLTVREGRVIVRAPLRVPDSVIESFLAEKGAWIRRQFSQASSQERSSSAQPPHLGSLFWLGEPLVIEVNESRITSTWSVRRDGLHLTLTGPEPLSSPRARQAVAAWYREAARVEFTRRVLEWSRKLGCQPKQIRIKDQKTRWGSCSSKGNLNFNWRLVQAPANVVDYVIVHELCHLREMNHSPRFWKLVGEAFPGYREAQAWLRQNGATLLAQDCAGCVSNT